MSFQEIGGSFPTAAYSECQHLACCDDGFYPNQTTRTAGTWKPLRIKAFLLSVKSTRIPTQAGGNAIWAVCVRSLQAVTSCSDVLEYQGEVTQY